MSRIQNSYLYFLPVICALLSVPSCSESYSSSASVDIDQVAKSEGAIKLVECRYKAFEIYRNNIQNGPEDGCTTTFSIDDASVKILSATCGMNAQSVSTVNWEYVGHTENDCTFLFEYMPPAGSTDETRQTRKVVFKGSPIVVFENDKSRTTLRLVSENASENGAR